MSTPVGADGLRQGGRDGRRGTYAAAAVAALLVIGVVAIVLGVRGSSGPPQPAAVAATPVTTAASPGRPSSEAPRSFAPPGAGTTTPAPVAPAPQPSFGRFFGASQPVRLVVSSIDLHVSTFVDLTIAADGTLNPPSSAQQVGLYGAGPTPGQLGPAVFGAHVDSKEGPGVFYRLGGTKVGDSIVVTRADAKVLTYTVDKVAVYPKDHFPTDDVYYGDSTQSQIRLVTCGGTFDRVKHYLDNVVVFGHLTSAA